MAEDSDVVVVTGASAGIGRVIARAFAEEGARLGLLARVAHAVMFQPNILVSIGK